MPTVSTTGCVLKDFYFIVSIFIVRSPLGDMRERNNISFSRYIISFSRYIISFSRYIISLVRNLEYMVGREIHRHLPDKKPIFLCYSSMYSCLMFIYSCKIIITNGIHCLLNIFDLFMKIFKV